MVSAVLHIVGLPSHGPLHALAVLTMVVGCLYCAWHMWNDPTVLDWAAVAAMNIGMIAIHQNMNTSATHAGHHGGPHSIDMTASVATPTAATMIAAAEAVFATIVLFAITRGDSAEGPARIARSPAGRSAHRPKHGKKVGSSSGGGNCSLRTHLGES
ncbi:hypothetical protein QMK17_24240 [Rhodococcus sp. G-MC3]|uniref:hypothetical protein n=1 Tax=Rhodococcus sp. G-MC3 TaxID=3046209 RepID=UPI0024BB9354|nr:hypothetical protein [Rhodococcus sp. G-MC3]MDJ0396419.1 hypothetical protein [Rhodococcus sp. G-MC3]